MGVNIQNPIIKKILGIVQHYDADKYWKMRDKVKKSGGYYHYGIFFALNGLMH